MAGLTMSYTAPQGVTVPNAYVRIGTFTGDTLRGKLEFVVGIYNTEADFNANRPAFSTTKYTIPFTDGLTIDAAYDWLLTRGEFQGATKVL